MTIKTFLLIIFTSFAINANLVLIDRAIAVINDEILTLSDVAIFFQIKTILSKKDFSISYNPSKHPFKMNKSKIKKYTEKLIVVEALSQEIQKVEGDQKYNIAKFKNKLINKFKTPYDYEKFFMPLGGNTELINQILTKNYISYKFIRTKTSELIKSKQTSSSISIFVTNLLKRNNIKYIKQRK